MLVCPNCLAVNEDPTNVWICLCGTSVTDDNTLTERHIQSGVGWTRPPQRNAWHVIHEYLAERWRSGLWDPVEFANWHRETWVPQIPTGCGCAEHWAKITEEFRIDGSSAESAFESLWRLHNLVSERHSKKPTISLAEAQGLFRCPVPRRPRAVITCAIGDHYLAVLELTRPRLRAYAQRCGAEYLEITDDLRPDWPMANKYRMAHLAWHYEQSLLIDCDVIVRPHAPDIFDAAGDAPIAGRDERPDYRDDWYINEASEFYDSQDVQFQIDRCMNAGVMVFRPDALERYSEPPKPIPSTGVPSSFGCTTKPAIYQFAGWTSDSTGPRFAAISRPDYQTPGSYI